MEAENMDNDMDSYACVLCGHVDINFKLLPCLHAVCSKPGCLSEADREGMLCTQVFNSSHAIIFRRFIRKYKFVFLDKPFYCPICLLKTDSNFLNSTTNPFKPVESPNIEDRNLECTYCVRKGKAVGYCKECASYLCSGCHEVSACFTVVKQA